MTFPIKYYLLPDMDMSLMDSKPDSIIEIQPFLIHEWFIESLVNARGDFVSETGIFPNVVIVTHKLLAMANLTREECRNLSSEDKSTWTRIHVIIDLLKKRRGTPIIDIFDMKVYTRDFYVNERDHPMYIFLEVKEEKKE